MACSRVSIASGARLLSTSKALFAKIRRDGPSGGVIMTGAMARISPSSAIRPAASSSNRAGVRRADSGRFDPNASA